MPFPRSRASRPRRRLATALLAACCCGCAGPAPVRAGATGPATAAAATAGPPPAVPDPLPLDPLAAQLRTYLRLLGPQGGTAAELSDFLSAVPADWPNRAVLARRLVRAIPAETDPAVLARFCSGAVAGARPNDDATLLACAAQPGGGGTAAPNPLLVADVRNAWARGVDDPSAEAPFLRDWGSSLRPVDHLVRFDRLDWNDALPAAERMLPLLAPADRPLAAARLAAHRADPGAPALATALPSAARSDPVLVLELARAARRAGRLDDALAEWRDRGAAAEAGADPARLSAFWNERDALSRALLAGGRTGDALFAASDPDARLPAAQRLDADLLRGWIELRFAGDAAAAEPLFAPLAAADAPITRARGLYWTARARAVRGDAAGARAALEEAATAPTTFYGQLALAELAAPEPRLLLDPAAIPPGLAGRFRALPAPRWDAAEAVSVSGRPYARAAELLVGWNDPKHAKPFLLALDRQLATPAAHAVAAELALRLELPDVAVTLARADARRGEVLLDAGWPRPFDPPAAPGGGGAALPPGLALAVMRQESSFDPGATSPAAARGLMQLTDATARTVSRELSRPDLADGGGALYDDGNNMLLGTAYLSRLLGRFDGSVFEAAAAYNAGPHRVERWLAQPQAPAPAPAAAGTDPSSRALDWIESIPFGETRNYVQRVMESAVIYRTLPRNPAGRAND